MKKNWLTKLDYRISLEVLVGVTLALYLLQQIAFYELLSEKVFIVSALLTFLGLVLGLLSTSLMLLIVNLILVSIGAFLLYFDPVIMLTKIKLLLIFVIPMYSVIAFFIKRTLYVRRLIAFREEYIHSYLKFYRSCFLITSNSLSSSQFINLHAIKSISRYSCSVISKITLNACCI